MASTTPMQLDDNLVNGQTYTFQFKCANWFCLTDLSATLQADFIAQAPDFLTSLQVTSPPTTDLYNVQFTYEGDGSDVVSDVAASLQAAALSVSNDNITFVGAVAASAEQVAVTPTEAVAATGAAITSAAVSTVQSIGTVAQTTVQQAGGVVQTATSQTLTAILPILIVVVLIILFVLPSLGKTVRESGVTLA
jgi:hypothetical protein